MLTATGFDVQVTVTITGPEPGYVATPAFLVEATFDLLKDRSEIVAATWMAGRGGVLSPGQLLRLHTNAYTTRLLANGGIKVSETEPAPQR